MLPRPATCRPAAHPPPLPTLPLQYLGYAQGRLDTPALFNAALVQWPDHDPNKSDGSLASCGT